MRDLARLLAGRGESITMSPATVQRILAEMVLKPHRFRYWLMRTDPAFERKMEAIVNLYLDPPRNSRLLCVDEKTGIQALERLHPTLPMRPGQIERREFEYIRHRVVDLLAAFDVRTGRVFGQCYRRHTNRELRHFLRALRARDPDRRWHLILAKPTRADPVDHPAENQRPYRGPPVEAPHPEPAREPQTAPAARPTRGAEARRGARHLRTGAVVEAWSSPEPVALGRHGGHRAKAPSQSPQEAALCLEDHAGGLRLVKIPRPLY